MLLKHTNQFRRSAAYLGPLDSNSSNTYSNLDVEFHTVLQLIVRLRPYRYQVEFKISMKRLRYAKIG